MPKNDGKLGGGFLRQTVLGSGVSLMLVIGKGEAHLGRSTLTCIDITTMTKTDVVVTTASPSVEPALGLIGASTKYKTQILQYMTGETGLWTRKQRKEFKKVVVPHMTYAIVAFRGYDQVPYIVGFLKTQPLNLESGPSKDKDPADGSDGLEKLNKPRLCTGLDNFMWKGTGDTRNLVMDEAATGGVAAAGFMLRDNGRIATVATHNVWMHLTNPVSNRWSAAHKKEKGSYRAPVHHLKNKSVLKKSPGVVNWTNNSYLDVNVSTIRQSGYYRFSAGYDCATWERPLYGRRTVAYLGRLASQLRRLAGVVSTGFGVMLENFNRINKIKVHNPATKAQVADFKLWVPTLLKDIYSGGNPLGMGDWIFRQHVETTGENAGHMPKFSDNITYHLPEEACDPTRIVPPLEQALCCEYIRMTDFGGINRFKENDPTNRTDGYRKNDFKQGVQSSSHLLAWKMRDVSIDVKAPATSSQAGSSKGEGEVLSANITGTPRFQEGGAGKAGVLKIHKPQNLYTVGKTAYELGCRLDNGGPEYTPIDNNTGLGGEVEVPDYKKVTARLNGSLTYLHYHNVEGHHGDPINRHQTEKMAGDWTGGVWNFARGYFRPQTFKFKK